MTHVAFTIKRKNFQGTLEMARQMAIMELEEFCNVDLSQFCDECLNRLVSINVYPERDDSATMKIEIIASINMDLYSELSGEDDENGGDNEKDIDDPEPSPTTPVTEPQPA